MVSRLHMAPVPLSPHTRVFTCEEQGTFSRKGSIVDPAETRSYLFDIKINIFFMDLYKGSTLSLIIYRFPWKTFLMLKMSFLIHNTLAPGRK